MVGSLTGVVASKKVTEAFKGILSMVGNHTQSVMAQECLTVRLTSRTGSKDGHSDPVILYGWVIAQRIKGTPGITVVGARNLRGSDFSTRGPSWTHLWCICCAARCSAE